MLITYSHNKPSRNTNPYTFSYKPNPSFIPSSKPTLSLLSKNEETNSSTHLFQNDILFNSSFLSECDSDFDFLTSINSISEDPFQSYEHFLTYYNTVEDKEQMIDELFQDKNKVLFLFETENGIEIILFILKQHHSLSLMNIVLYYVSLVIHECKVDKMKELVEYLFYRGNVFIRKQLSSFV